MKRKARKQKRGPKTETLKITGKWEDAVKKAVSKERPKEGWPDTPKSE
jgi:hypothetical protein